MDLFECFGRYLGQRLDSGSLISYRSSLSRLLVAAILTWTFCCFILLVLADKSANQPHSNWPQLRFNQNTQLVDNLLIDEKDESVFIASKSGIYKYSSKFEQLLTSTDASASTSGKVNTSHELFQPNITNKLLFIVRRNNPNLLLSCWLDGSQQQSLKCWINKLNDLRLGNVLALLKDYKLSPDDRLIGSLASERPDFIIASSLSFLPNQESPFRSSDMSAIGRFEVIKSTTAEGAKYLTLNQRSALNYQPNPSSSNARYEYIYIFNSNNHTYFILNELKQQLPADTLTTPKTDYYSVRLARICSSDTDLTSYVEISITCNDKLDNLRAKTAFIEPLKQDVLTITFEETDESKSSSSTATSKRQRHNSLLCSYSMKWIDDLFSKAVSECNNGFQSANLLLKFHPYLNPPPCQKNPSLNHDWCTSKTNPYIDGTQRYNLKEDNYVNLDHFKSINFIHITLQGTKQKEVIYIGTESGLLTKITQDEPLYTIDFNTFTIKTHVLGEKFKPLEDVFNLNDVGTSTRARYSVNSRGIYVVSPQGNSVSRIEIDSCSYYSTCKSCLIAQDPLECVWCGDVCSQKQECDSHNQTNLSCPPLIKQFHPKIGPLTGMTHLKIEGENLGSPKGLLAVRLNEQYCVVDKTLSTSEFIECTVQPVKDPVNATLSIDVLDESHTIDSKGSFVSKESYSYVKPVIHGFSQTYTTTKNGTIIKIVGENLHAGSSRQLFLHEQECNIIEYNMSMIKCLLAFQQSNDDLILQPKLMIDGVVQHFDFIAYNNNETLVANLTLNFESNGQTSTMISTIEQGENFSLMEPLVGISLLVLVVIVIVSRFKEISTWSSKLSKRYIPSFCYSDDREDNHKVSFRDIQVRNSSQTNFNTGGDSTNGLIKLNGSIMSTDYFGKQENLEQDQLLMNNFVDNETLALLMHQKILIDRGRLTLGHVLGSGQFGRVYKGFLKVERTGEHAAVAVKTLHSRSTWDDAMDNRAFLEEGLMMKDFEHENVLALIGVTFDSNGLPMVITPFMLYGDLRSYISDETSSPTVKELIDFGTQVARGMAYLSSLKFVHRDLAARNCMLDENLTVKVADFGLSRDIYERDYYSSDNKKAKLPVKWMAIESLEKSIYNTKTDVWSYGVLLWELMTRGVVPYPDIDNFDLFSYLKEGRRMLRPRYCPIILYKIMLECWDENPQCRPTFVELDEKVSAVITNLKIAKDGQQTVDRDETYCDVLK